MANRIQQVLSGALRTYREAGAASFFNRTVLWLRGERRYHARPISVIPDQSTTSSTVSKNNLSILAKAQLPFAPLVSVVIPIHNALSYAQACVDSLMRMKTDLDFEIVLIDNGSAPDVGVWMGKLLGNNRCITAFRLETNIGYGASMNVGVRAARGDFLVLANSDTEFTDYSIDLLVNTMRRNPNIGVLSPITNYVGEGPQIAPDARDLKPTEAQDFAAKVRQCDELIVVPERVAFFCVMMRRTVYQLLNGFDEAFLMGNFEDENLCSRVHLLGLSIAIAKNSFVYHHGSKTFEGNRINHNHWMVHNSVLYQNRLAAFSTDATLLERKRIANGKPTHSTPKFSIIVRTRNRPEKLRLALNSLAMQSFDNFEVIVVNDAGEDVAEVIQPFEAFFPIQYVSHTTPQTPSGATNSALHIMKGDYFVHLDDDDIVFPFHLDLFHQASLEHPDARVLYSGYSRVLMEDNGETMVPVQRIGIPFWDFNAEALLHSNYIVIHAAMLHRDVHERVGDYDRELFVLQDWDYLVRASRHYAFTPIKRVTCEYRFYQSMSNNLINRREKTLDEMRMLYAKHPTTERSTENARKKELDTYQAQLKMIQKLRDQVARGEKTERQITSEILHELLGFAVEK